jgi:hypothetical protein
MICKWYEIETYNGFKKVQGLGEKFTAEILNRFGYNWDRPKAIKTPYGNYSPDFFIPNIGGENPFFIEVKGMRTALKMVGLLSLLENGKAKWAGSIDEISYNKMVWVHENIHPIIIYINNNDNDHKYKDWKNDLYSKLESFKVIYGKENLKLTIKNGWFKKYDC